MSNTDLSDNKRPCSANAAVSFPVGSVFGQLEYPGFHREGMDNEAQTSEAVVAAALCSFWR